MPADVERMVKKLEKHEDKIEDPWALSQWMKQKGYKMPEKKKAEEDAFKPPKVERYQPKTEAYPPFKREVKRKSVDPTELRSETAEEDLPKTPGETMKDYKPKGTKPTFIDTKPSGKGKPIREYAETDKKPRVVPGKSAPKTREYLKERKLLAEEDSPRDRDYTVWLRQKDDKKKFRGEEGFDSKEVEMGMKEEREHDDITKGNPELVKKIVLAHLREDPQYYTKLKSVMKAGRSLDREGLIDFYNFMSWMNNKGFKAEEEKQLDEYMNQYEVDKMAEEQKEKEPEFHAEEEDVLSKVKNILDPSPGKNKSVSLPPLTKTTMRKTVKRMGV